MHDVFSVDHDHGMAKTIMRALACLVRGSPLKLFSKCSEHEHCSEVGFILNSCCIFKILSTISQIINTQKGENLHFITLKWTETKNNFIYF